MGKFEGLQQHHCQVILLADSNAGLHQMAASWRVVQDSMRSSIDLDNGSLVPLRNVF